ncbi:MAG: DUF3006 domain-containing protein [Ruminococcus sp.]|nr:DUF3006 domain-containing protein [Ruminococcus sp.]
MYYSVDRLDENYISVCDDDGETKEIRRVHFEGDVRVGQVYRFEQGRFIYDEQETALRRERIKQLQDELFK